MPLDLALRSNSWTVRQFIPGFASFLTSVVFVARDLTGINCLFDRSCLHLARLRAFHKEEGHHGARSRQPRRRRQPSPRPRTHDVDQRRRSMDGFGRRTDAIAPARPGRGGARRGADEADHSDHCERYDIVLLADRFGRRAQGRSGSRCQRSRAWCAIRIRHHRPDQHSQERRYVEPGGDRHRAHAVCRARQADR